MTDQGDRSTPKTDLAPASPPVELAAADLRLKLPVDAAELERAASQGQVEELLGQGRALDAIRLAIGVGGPGYNVFVSGLRTRQERDTVVRLLTEKAATMPTPGDWVYVHNFKSPESPVAIYLEAGQGLALHSRVADLVSYIVDQLPKSFRREDFDQERTALREKYNKRAQELFGGLEQRARERGFAVQAAPTGQIILIPLVEGKVPESPEALNQAMQNKTDTEREELARVQAELQEQLGMILLKQQEIMRELIDDIRAIERAFASRLIKPAIAELKGHFSNPGVDSYLDDMSDHMLRHLERFRERGEAGEQGPFPVMQPGGDEGGRRFVEYQVNVMVENSRTKGAPVVIEDAPNYRNLFGTIERWIDPLGRSGTNFTRIIGGSYIKSHGGFLVFDLEDAVVEPGVWKTIKRSLKSGRLTVETYEPLPFFATSGLRPKPIEVENKVVVLGGRYLYNLLYFYDQDFGELFKVKAEMRPAVDANRETALQYAARVGTLARRENLPLFDASALVKIVEFGMRMAGDRDRVIAMLEPIDDLAREAAFFARADSVEKVSARNVERALIERRLRLNFIEEEIRRLIANRTLVVNITGKSVGQINGLAVLDVGGYAFGRPSRVSITVALGQAGLINIEREARLSGATHDKGVMILSGFLRSRFAQQHAISMTASIAFEQSYSGIDGDSASSTELYGLLSAISAVPIRQDLAVTGSVDQFGNVQAIGGANEKIEGFYRVCKAIGLTGTQGVLLPRANLANLMLEPETTAAIERGQFHIYPVDTIDQGIEILTGVRAGSISEPGTINGLVDANLKRMAEALRDRAPQETRIVQEPAAAPQPPKPPEPPEPQR